MAKPQITVRLSPSLMEELTQYIERTGTSKTDVVASALAQYLDCAEEVPLGQRMADLEKKVKALEAKV
ncbi:MAG: ribbon-helix-helix protein, CopG family [Xenococcus sp. (in: cyanobacteria)]